MIRSYGGDEGMLLKFKQLLKKKTYKRNTPAEQELQGTGMRRAIITPKLLQTNGREMKQILSGERTGNVFVIGTPGSGRCHHPWDNLKPCSCGCKERPLLMYDKDKLYYCGGPSDSVMAICYICGRHTEKTDVGLAIDNWNADVVLSVAN